MSGVAAISRDTLRVAGLGLLLGYLLIERLYELRLSARHARALRARGAVEHGRGHFPMLVALHTAFPIALATEVGLAIGSERSATTPLAGWPLWLALFLGAQGMRRWAMRALGEFWNVRVWVLPGASRIRRGPYRFLRHPNYVAVVVEFLAAPLMFGAWRTAVAFSLMNLVALAVRVRVEERALTQAAAAHDPRPADAALPVPSTPRAG